LIHLEKVARLRQLIYETTKEYFNNMYTRKFVFKIFRRSRYLCMYVCVCMCIYIYVSMYVYISHSHRIQYVYIPIVEY